MAANALAGKIAITGTGRCGTTFLMRMFTALDPGLTGYRHHAETVLPDIQAGMEHQADATWSPAELAALPPIWKDPGLCFHLEALVQAGHRPAVVLLPVRDLGTAARSRFKANRPWFPHQGHNLADVPVSARPAWATLENQERVMAEALGRLVATTLLHEIDLAVVMWDRLGDPVGLADDLAYSPAAQPLAEALGLDPGSSMTRSTLWRRIVEAHEATWGKLVSTYRAGELAVGRTP